MDQIKQKYLHCWVLIKHRDKLEKWRCEREKSFDQTPLLGSAACLWKMEQRSSAVWNLAHWHQSSMLFNPLSWGRALISGSTVWRQLLWWRDKRATSESLCRTLTVRGNVENKSISGTRQSETTREQTGNSSQNVSIITFSSLTERWTDCFNLLCFKSLMYSISQRKESQE